MPAKLATIKAAPGAGQDALVLGVSLPGEHARASEVWLHAGRVGREKAVAGLRSLNGGGGAVVPSPDVNVVEGPLGAGGGYVLEAFIPWRLVASADSWEPPHGPAGALDAHISRKTRSVKQRRSRGGAFVRPTSTHASWLNLVERFFGLLTEHALRRGSHTSTRALRLAIHEHLDAHNEAPKLPGD